MLLLCVYLSEHLSAVEGCVFGGVFTSRVSMAVLCVSLDAGLLCPGGRGIALGGCLGDFFLGYMCPPLVVPVYVCVFVFCESMSGYLLGMRA